MSTPASIISRAVFMASFMVAALLDGTKESGVQLRIPMT
jgi:hypothetical protein